MTALREFYCLFTHRVGPERRMVLHPVDAATAERMAWVAFSGSRQRVVLVEATNFEALAVAK